MVSDDDSFNRPVPRSVPLTQASCSSKEQEEDVDSDDSFDNFEPTKIGNTQQQTQQRVDTQQKTNVENNRKMPTPLWWQQSQRMKDSQQPKILKPMIPPNQPQVKNGQKGQGGNTSFTRHGSDNSFFKGPAGSQIVKTVKTTPPPRPSTPSGEVVMLKNQLENEKKNMQKLAANYQKIIHEMGEKHKEEMEKKKEFCQKLEKENEILKTTTIHKKIEKPSSDKKMLGENSPNNVEVRKIMVKIPQPSGSRVKYMSCKTPVSKKAVRISTPLSAFQHENRFKMGKRKDFDEDDDNTFQLEDSFQPQVTSTPIGPAHVTRLNGLGLRRQLNLDDEENGEPTPKKMQFTKDEDNQDVEMKEPRKRRSLKEIREMRSGEEEEKEDPEKIPETKPENMEILELSRQVISKKKQRRMKEEKMTKSKIREILSQVGKIKQKPSKCAKCEVGEIRKMTSSSSSEAGTMKEWEKMEAQRNDKEQRIAESQMTRMFSKMLQNISKPKSDDAEETRNEEEAEDDLTFEKRTLEHIRLDVEERWRSDFMEELHRKGDLLAELEPGGCYSKQSEDYIWTSDSDDQDCDFPSESDYDKWSLCDPCFRRQRNERRIWKRERRKIDLKIDCFNEIGKERMDQMKNVSILTKSKIEEADMELKQQMDEIMGGKLLDDDEEEDSSMF